MVDGNSSDHRAGNLASAYELSLPGEARPPAGEPGSGALLAGLEVSSLGRLRNKRGRMLRDRQWGSYRGCTVAMGGGRLPSFYVHRLVARAFLGAPPSPGYVHVHHVDSDSSNNRADNLAYACDLSLPGEEWRPAEELGSGAPLTNLEMSSPGRLRTQRGRCCAAGGGGHLAT